MTYKVAIIGATGNVGLVILEILSEYKLPIKEVVVVASSDSIGKKVSYGDQQLIVQNIEHYDFIGTDFAIFAATKEVAKYYAPIANLANCLVIDNSAYFRMNKDVALIIPEVNSACLADFDSKIIANPNCSTIQLLMALKPLSMVASIKRVVVSTYQSTSGAGKSAMDELYQQTKGIYSFNKFPPINFEKQIAFNVIPKIDDYLADGSTKEEEKIVNESKKILNSNIAISATCVRVPTFIGHSQSINIEFNEDISVNLAISTLAKAKGIKVANRIDDYQTPVEIAGEDLVYISRVRKDNSVKFGLNLWSVTDNLRKGAALNAVQILATLIKTAKKRK